MRIEKVNVYLVNGLEVLAKTEEDLNEYLAESEVSTKEYLGVKQVKAVGREFIDTNVKELRHMKINVLYEVEEETTKETA